MSIAKTIFDIILFPWVVMRHGWRATFTKATQDVKALEDRSGLRISTNTMTGFVSIRGRNIREVGRHEDWVYFHIDGDETGWFDVDVGTLERSS